MGGVKGGGGESRGAPAVFKLDYLISHRKMAQASSVDDQGKDSDVSFAHKKDEVGQVVLKGSVCDL